VTLSDTEWEDPPAPAESPVDQDLLIETARRRLQALLNRAADAEIAAALGGAEPEAESAVPGMAEAVAAALRELEDEQLDEAAATAGAALDPASENDEPKLYFETLPDFVSKFLTQAYRREIPAKAAWCTEWWKHPEAVCRLSAMWRSWEALRLEPGTGTSVWWRDHADHHMAKLLDPQGPFKGCTKEAHGANKVLQPLPFGDPPPELYAPLTYAI
jgi:hypothetical protein